MGSAAAANKTRQYKATNGGGDNREASQAVNQARSYYGLQQPSLGSASRITLKGEIQKQKWIIFFCFKIKIKIRITDCEPIAFHQMTVC